MTSLISCIRSGVTIVSSFSFLRPHSGQVSNVFFVNFTVFFFIFVSFVRIPMDTIVTGGNRKNQSKTKFIITIVLQNKFKPDRFTSIKKANRSCKPKYNMIYYLCGKIPPGGNPESLDILPVRILNLVRISVLRV